jgi:membrane protein implicated in regulation of membrane protease activity
MSLLDSIGDLVGVSAPSTIEIIFVCCAVFGTLFFLIMMILMLVGDILGGVVDTAFDTDFSMDTDLSFELFSLQGISAAIMMFGYVGMYTVTSGGSEFLAVLAGGLSSVASAYAVKVMMKGIVNLQTDGTMQIEKAIGSQGHVYVRIRKGSTGEVQVPIQNSLRTMTARAKGGKTHIETGTLIRVVDVIGSTLIVEELIDEEE